MTRTIIQQYQEAEGWTDATVLDLLIGYIENQNSPEALEEYLSEASSRYQEEEDPE